MIAPHATQIRVDPREHLRQQLEMLLGKVVQVTTCSAHVFGYDFYTPDTWGIITPSGLEHVLSFSEDLLFGIRSLAYQPRVIVPGPRTETFLKDLVYLPFAEPESQNHRTGMMSIDECALSLEAYDAWVTRVLQAHHLSPTLHEHHSKAGINLAVTYHDHGQDVRDKDCRIFQSPALAFGSQQPPLLNAALLQEPSEEKSIA